MTDVEGVRVKSAVALSSGDVFRFGGVWEQVRAVHVSAGFVAVSCVSGEVVRIGARSPVSVR